MSDLDTNPAPTAPVDLAPLFAALAAAQASIQAVGKDGKNNHQNYAYTTSEAVIDAARVALAPQGLAAFRVRYDIPDKGSNDFAIHSVYMLVHSSGASMDFTNIWIASPGKGRPDDKAMAGALTTGLAYWLRDLLLIPRKDDAEADQRDDRNFSPSFRPQPQQHRAVQRPPQQYPAVKREAVQPKPAHQGKPQLSELGFSKACADMSLSRNLVEAWREEVSPKSEWSDFRRGGVVAILKGYGGKWELARGIEPTGPAAWELFDSLTEGTAGGAAIAAGVEGIEAHELMRGDWLVEFIGRSK